MRKEPMAISEFALNYKKQITLNYDQMMETHKALCARLSDLMNRGVSLNDDRMRTTLAVSGLLNELIAEGTLVAEAEEAALEAEALNDPNFMDRLVEQNDLPEDNPQ